MSVMMYSSEQKKMETINSKTEYLLSTSFDPHGGVELTTTTSSVGASYITQQPQHDDMAAGQRRNINDNNPLVVSTDEFYLPLSSHVDDNPTITVYEEAKEMLLSAILLYGVVHLRELATKKQQQTHGTSGEGDGNMNTTKTTMSSILAEHLFTLPISAREVVRLVSKYREDIVAEIGRESTVDLYLTAFDDIQTSKSSRELELELNAVTSQISLVSVDIVVVEDDHADRDLVYAICVDTSRRRITVSFRGCACRTDWLVCCKTIQKVLENPLYRPRSSTTTTTGSQPPPDHDSSPHSQSGVGGRRQPRNISIHSGYYNYLFSPRGKDGETKFDSIIGHLNRLLQQYPGYNVYVTGHSLGAALATVCSFHLAASGRLRSYDLSSHESPTVTCINFASPMVGNFDFETAFRELEDQGKIRCLRVTNYYDIFTQLPDRGNWLYLLMFVPWIGVHLLAYFGFSLLFFMCLQTNVYRHVGMNLHMYSRHKCWTAWLPFRKRTNQNHPDWNPDENDNQFRYWFKIKHSNGTSEYFALRVVHDFKKHMKQLVQRLLALPLLTDFDTNHRAHEHLQRIKGLECELKQIQLKDLYGLRTPPTSPFESCLDIPTNQCFV
jgi:hypothetical protein